MSTVQIPPLEQQISSALDACLRKMADHLQKNFDPLKDDSLALFKQFCAALKVRLHWLDKIEEVGMLLKKVKEQMQPKTEPKPMNGSAQPGSNGDPLQRMNSNNPMKPEHLNSGLVYKR